MEIQACRTCRWKYRFWPGTGRVCLRALRHFQQSTWTKVMGILKIPYFWAGSLQTRPARRKFKGFKVLETLGSLERPGATKVESISRLKTAIAWKSCLNPVLCISTEVKILKVQRNWYNITTRGTCWAILNHQLRQVGLKRNFTSQQVFPMSSKKAKTVPVKKRKKYAAWQAFYLCGTPGSKQVASKRYTFFRGGPSYNHIWVDKILVCDRTIFKWWHSAWICIVFT